MFSFSSYDSSQRLAIEEGDGIVIVKAGPGSGKTKTLTGRIAYLIAEKQLNPKQILALTFTRRAAAEMKERLRLLLSEDSSLPEVTTFHGWAYEILRSRGQGKKIITEHERSNIITQIAKDTKTKLSPQDLSLVISLAKSSIESLLIGGDTEELIKLYQNQLTVRCAYDYDDLLVEIYNLILSDRKLKEELVSRYKYFFVDEFQDTNDIQYQILKQVIVKSGNLFVIGDPYQSIYSFRGANPSVFKTLVTEYRDCKVIDLEANYRSLSNIVNISNQLFPEVAAKPVDCRDGLVAMVETLNEYSEADWVINLINEKIGGKDLLSCSDYGSISRFSDFAIIVRTHRTSSVLSNKLKDSGLPFQVAGGMSLYEDEEVHLLCTIMRYLTSPSDDLLSELAKLDVGGSLLKEIKRLSLGEAEPLTVLVNRLAQLCQIAHNSVIFQHFIGNVIQFDRYPDGLNRFVNYYEQIKDADFFDFKCDKIALLTMHAAKGLEFKHVILCGFEEGLIPYVKKGADIDEEKRLFYVALTRAKEELYITRCHKRYGRKVAPSTFEGLIASPSLMRLKDEQSEKIIKRIEKDKIKKSHISLFNE